MTMTLRTGVWMKTAGVPAAILVLLLTGCGQREAVVDSTAKQARGKYLVENVGMCADCHTPRGPGGMFDQSRWLQGSTLGFAPLGPMPMWAPAAPPIAGLQNYSDEQAVALLTTGATIHGQPLRPPMPPYRFKREDAESVVAYLRSLK